MSSVNPTIKVRVNDKVVNVRVCWPIAKIKALESRHEDGIVDLASIDINTYRGSANKLDLEYIFSTATMLAQKED